MTTTIQTGSQLMGLEEVQPFLLYLSAPYSTFYFQLDRYARKYDTIREFNFLTPTVVIWVRYSYKEASCAGPV